MKDSCASAKSLSVILFIIFSLTGLTFAGQLSAAQLDPVVYLPSASNPSFEGTTADLSFENGKLKPRPDNSPGQGTGAVMDVEVISSTGALKATLPVAVPPGRNGMTPTIKLVYNSSFPNGWIGLGWRLNIGTIQRSTRHGLDYASKSFDIVEGGVHSELSSRPEWGLNYYGRKSERAFSKFSYRGAKNGWVVFRKDGRRYFYGTTTGSRTVTAKGVFSWHLNRVEDANGNYLTYSYQKVVGCLYLSEISYTGHVQRGLAPSNRVKFILAERPDKILDGRMAEVVALSQRLSVIEVYAGHKLCRKYKFEYEEGPNSGRSRLKEILPLGADGISALPPITLDWHQSGKIDFGTPIQSSRTVHYRDPFGDQEKVSLADVNGDARTDIIINRGLRFYHRISNGDGTFEAIDSQKYYQMGELIGHADVNGDGYSDITSYRRSYDGAPLYLYVLLGKGEGTYGAPVISKIPGTLREPPINPNPYPGDWDQTPLIPVQGHLLRCKTYLADINADGLTDVTFQWGGFWGHKLSNGDGTFRASDKTIFSLGDTLGLVDVNSDGLADILTWRRFGKYTYFYVYLGRGDGTYDKAIQSKVFSGNIPGNAVPILGDFNGDGHPDVVLKNYLQCWPMFAGADGKFKAGSVLNIPHMLTNQIYLADVTGDGIDDFLGFWDQFQAYRQYITVSAGQVSASQDLLHSISSSGGANYSVVYRPSSAYSNSALPFAIHTVAAVGIDDGLGGISETRFEYSKGLFDPETRSFAGFGYTQKTNPDQSTVESWIHQDEHRRGLAFKIDQREPASNGARLVRTTIEWGTEEFTSGSASGVFVSRKMKTVKIMDHSVVFNRDRYEYNSENGNMLVHETSGTDAEMVTQKFEYENFSDWFWRKTNETVEGEAGGQVRKRNYGYENITGNLLSVSSWLQDAQNPTVSFSYDDYGNQLSVTDSRGYTSSIEYDATTHTLPVSRTNPLGHTIHFTWDDRFGKTTRVIDENNNETIHDYDVYGRLVTKKHPDGGVQSYEYDDQAMPRVVVSRNREDLAGNTVDKYEYFDGLGRKVQTISFGEEGKKIVNRRFYDAMGRNDLIEGPFFSSSSLGWPMASPASYTWKQMNFDYLGRPMSVESSDGDHGSVVTTTSYEGFAKTVADPDGAVKIERRDYMGRIIKVIERTDQGDINTSYSYNAAGDLLKVVDHYGNSTSIQYDSLGRKIQMTDPDMGLWRYAYDANNNVLKQVDAKQQIIEFAYDPLNRLISKNYSTDDPSVSYEYDSSGVPNGIGRLHSISNTIAVTSTNAYDEMGRVLSASKTFAGNPQPFTTEFDYDLSGKQVRMSYPDGYQVSNAFYPGTNLLQKVSGEDGTEFAYLTAYEPSGKIGRMDHGNGTYTIHSYDPDTARISSIVTGRLGPVDTFQEKHYSYSKAGDIIRITDNVDDVVLDYSYDKLHRLTGEISDKYEPISYTYDAIGNITSKTVGLTSMVYSYDSDHPHAVKSISLNGSPYDYTYDANGNMISGPDFSNPQNVASRNFTYNADNMPLSVSRVLGDIAVLNQFQYDGSSARLRKNSSKNAETIYISETSELIDGVFHHYVFAGNLRVAKIANGELSFYHKDHIGSSSVVSNAYGEAINSTSYRPFGSVRKSAGNHEVKYGYTDQERDAEIGLHNYKARMYDAAIDRFIIADTIVPRMYTPQSLNRYSYCRNNPLIYTDPTGHYDDQGNNGDTAAFGHEGTAFGSDDGQDESDCGANGGFDSSVVDNEYVDVKGNSILIGFNSQNSDSFSIVRKGALILGILDCLPFGIFPGITQAIGEIIDLSAAIIAQGVLITDYGTGKISSAQYYVGSGLNVANFAVGSLGNVLTGAGNVVLSFVEAGILGATIAATSPNEAQNNNEGLKN